MRKLILAVIVVCALYYAFHRTDVAPSTQRDIPDATTADETATPSLAPESWGSGHEAGYQWAEDKGISDESDCEAAGEQSNSPSFAEGCESFVNGDSDN